MPTTPTKTTNALFTMQQVASNTVLKSSAIDVSTKWAADICLKIGKDNTGAFSNAWDVVAQISPEASGDDKWIDIPIGRIPTTASEGESVTGTEAAGATVIEVASTLNLEVGDKVLLKNSTAGNSEFGTIVSVVTNTSITLLDGITNAQTGSTIYDNAVEIYAHLNLEGVKRLRVALLSGTSGQSYMVVGDAVTFDSF